MRGPILFALCLLGLPPARADDGRRSRLLVAYVAGRDAVSEKRIGPVLDIWRGMHREYPRWSLRCLLVTGGARTVYTADATCARLALDVDDSYLALGHKVKALLSWVAAHQPEPYDFPPPLTQFMRRGSRARLPAASSHGTHLCTVLYCDAIPQFISGSAPKGEDPMSGS